MKIGIVVPVLCAHDLAVDAIYSFKSQQHDVQVFIQPQYRLQVPLARAWNRGWVEAYKANCDLIVITNDDVLFAPHTLDYLAHEYEHREENVVLHFPLDIVSELDDPSDILFSSEEDSWKAEWIEDQAFSCFMSDRTLFDKIGTFDENFDPAWWEDADYRYRIHLLGFKTKSTSVPYVHLRHQTTKRLSNLPLNSLQSGNYYGSKWGSTLKNLDELYKTPYNGDMSPKEWRRM